MHKKFFRRLSALSRGWILTALLLVLLTPVALAGFWFSEGPWGISDWDQYFSRHEGYRRTILTYREFPRWDPYTCGGTAALADPEFPVLSPTFALELLFGVPVGLKLSIFLSTMVGAVGMVALGRRLALSPPAAFVAALAAFFGSVNLLELVEGHVNIFAVMWIPWVLWAWIGAYRKQNTSLLVGLFLALTFYQGGIYLLFYAGLAFLLLPFLTQHPRRAFRISALAGLWALGFSAFKLVPVLLWLRQVPDEMYASSAFTLSSLHHILLGRYLHGAQVIPNQESGWHEYGAYLGPIVLGLAVLGSLRLFKERLSRALVITAVLVLLVSSSGPFIKPLFDVIPVIPRSNISRVILFAVLPLALLAGVGLDRIRVRLPRAAPLLVPLLLGLVALDLLSLAYPLSRQAFVVPPLSPPLPAASPPIAFTGRRHRVKVDDERYSRTYAAMLAGYGTTAWCGVLGPGSHIHTIEDEAPQEYVALEEHHGTAELVKWSPNTVRVRVAATMPDKVILNTNFAKGWRANGEPAENVDGRLAMPVFEGTQEMTFSYVPLGAAAGVMISVLSVLAAFISARRKSTIKKESRPA